MTHAGPLSVLLMLSSLNAAAPQSSRLIDESGVRFDKTRVDFGKVASGQTMARDISVRISRTAFDSKRTRLEAGKGSVLGIRQVSSTFNAKDGVVVRTYRVFVPSGAPAGPLKATLHITGLAGNRHSPSISVVGEVVAANAHAVTTQPIIGQVVPAFTLNDIAGKPSGLAAVAKKPAALFFFCGCDACKACATQWSQLQLTGALTPSAASETGNRAEPATVIIYSGNALELETLAMSTGLDKQMTLLLPDPMMTATNLYGVDPCPRVFVIDANGKLRYTNNHADDQPQKAPAEAIIAHTVDALQAIQKSQ